ncbi:E3 ubiquitin/ISG15 ligase TRIM25 [Camelus dromedarius]|uniref:E3 ubiquitin/ISG15 ligase TRIM25 n=1 Tax=Camelus dromedarius TaxID=9838 RepID=A0A5N4D3D7_CAMDR|nr:E3 ubiquitin/ISG15 ligase TRIM25 [Camelus dromedarius]
MAELCPLAEELSCSICLEPFKEPVTTPCGHNFCGSCLDETWAVQGPPYLCPHCRNSYQTRPQLCKNTVLCAVVEQFLQAELARPAPPNDWTPPARAAASSTPSPVACDHCLQATAVKTCLVCMASFCQEHLKPHLESPAFQDHSLQPPVRDLMQRKCPQHNRLRDFFCTEHNECICHICLVEHKTCSPAPLSQASAELENKLRHKLGIMYCQINGASRALEDVRARQQDVREAAHRKLDQLKQEHLEMKALIDAAEASSTRKIKEEEKRVISKFDHVYQVLLKKKSEIQTFKEEIELALSKGDEFEFLEVGHDEAVVGYSQPYDVDHSLAHKALGDRPAFASRLISGHELSKKDSESASGSRDTKAAKLQGITTKPVYVPKVELNHELIKGICQGTTDLKNELKQSITHLQNKKPEEPTVPGDPGGHSLLAAQKPTRPGKKLQKEEKKPKKPPIALPGKNLCFGAPEQLVEVKQTDQEAAAKVVTLPPTSESLKAKVLETFLVKSRPELLQYAVKVILDYNTAHNKVALSKTYTVASVADTSQNYRPHPQRFTYCPQVLGLHCYKKGIHYWEAELQKNNFCGVGICYGSMDRQGPESRLGRNSASWCVEWFNTKISSWHNNVEKTLPTTKATRVGVLLNCDHGFVIFFAVATDRVHLLYKFKEDFTEALYPAFWVFSTGATISICSSK